MNTFYLTRALFLGISLAPLLTKGQNDFVKGPDVRVKMPGVYAVSVSGAGNGAASGLEENGIKSNVPLNEISIRAFRYLHRHFRTAASESWVKTEDGITVNFFENALQHQAYFSTKGSFRYSLKYYSGKDLTREVALPVQRRYPGYSIDVVTELTDGDKILYLLKIKNSSSLKTLSVCDGRIEVQEELINGGM